MKKDELVNMLIQRNNINEIEDDYRKQIYKQRLNEFINDLYDSNKEVVHPLNKAETLVFREKYGIFNDGVEKTPDSIAQMLNVSMSRIYQRLSKAHIEINSHIIDKAKFVELTSNNEDRAIFIEEMKLSTRSYNALKRIGFFKMEEVSRLTTDELLKLNKLGSVCAEEIIDSMHRHGYCFADEYAVVSGSVVDSKTLNYNPEVINIEDITMNKQLWIERYVYLKKQKKQLTSQIKRIDEEMNRMQNNINEAEVYDIKIKSKTT